MLRGLFLFIYKIRKAWEYAQLSCIEDERYIDGQVGFLYSNLRGFYAEKEKSIRENKTMIKFILSNVWEKAFKEGSLITQQAIMQGLEENTNTNN